MFIFFQQSKHAIYSKESFTPGWKRWKAIKKQGGAIAGIKKMRTFAPAKTGKSYTASSLWILQGLTAAKVTGRSGAM